jgi:hypothetical protein
VNWLSIPRAAKAMVAKATIRACARRPKAAPATPLTASFAATTGPRRGVTRKVGRIVP